MIQESAALRRRHLPAAVNRGPQIDEPAAPVRHHEGHHQAARPEDAAAQHSQAQAAVLRGALRHAPRRQGHQGEGRDPVDRQPQAQRAVGAERHHENEAGERRADDAADGVERVRGADVPRARLARLRDEIGEQGERHPHPQRGHEHDGTDGESHQQQPRRGTEAVDLEHGEDVQRQPREEDEQPRGARRRHPLGEPGRRRRHGALGAAPSHQGAPQPDSQQEHHEDQGECVGGSAHDHYQHAGPGDLVEQGGEGGAAEQHERHGVERVPVARYPGLAPGVNRGRERRDGPRQGDRRGAQSDVYGGRDPQGHADPDVLDEDEPGQGRADHGAEGVQRIEPPQPALERRTIGSGQGAGQNREGAAHEGGRHEEHERGEPEAQREAAKGAGTQRCGGADVGVAREPEDRGRDDPEHADGDLQPAVERGGARVAVGAAAEQPGAESQAAHVGGHDRRDRLDRGAERLVEQAHPEELVHEPGGPGKKEEGAVAERPRTHAARASPARDSPPGAG